MGVPGFSTWFSTVCCPQAFVDHKGQKFDYVYVDMASVLHTVLRRGTTYPYKLQGHITSLRKFAPNHRMLLLELIHVLWSHMMLTDTALSPQKRQYSNRKKSFDLFAASEPHSSIEPCLNQRTWCRRRVRRLKAKTCIELVQLLKWQLLPLPCRTSLEGQYRICLYSAVC